MKKTDSIAFAKKLAEKLVVDAWKDLENMIPDCSAKKKLKKLAEYNVGRNIWYFEKKCNIVLFLYVLLYILMIFF